MSDTNLNRFPSARSPLCAIPTNPADHASRTVCAIAKYRTKISKPTGNPEISRRG